MTAAGHSIYGDAMPKAGGQNGPGLAQHLERAAAASVAVAWRRRDAQRKQAQSGAEPTDLAADPQYPQDWNAYIGQEQAKETVQAAIGRAMQRNEPCRHVLIANGVPGIGKTALAVLVARAMHSRCYTVTGTPNWQQVRSLVLSMQPRDVLFIDEIHRLVFGGKGKAEWLLHVLQDDALIGPNGVEKAHLGITVIGATTDVSKLPATLIERFGVNPILQPYSQNEAAWIAYGVAQRIFAPKPTPSSEDLAAVVDAADRNPRRIRQILEALVDSCYEPEGYSLDRVMLRLHVTYDGLDHASQRYLVLLRRSVGAMGETQLRNLLREASLEHIERRLADKGLVAFTRSGRVLTADGINRANQLIEDGVTL